MQPQVSIYLFSLFKSSLERHEGILLFFCNLKKAIQRAKVQNLFFTFHRARRRFIVFFRLSMEAPLKLCFIVYKERTKETRGPQMTTLKGVSTGNSSCYLPVSVDCRHSKLTTSRSSHSLSKSPNHPCLPPPNKRIDHPSFAFYWPP